MKYTGKIITLAFPDTFVKHSDEFILKILPLLGLGKKGYIKAGHAAFVLIDNRSRKALYFDFGRYITPNGFGRVRSAETDVELEIPFQAKINKHQRLVNLEDFLVWLASNPQKTHGDGRLVAAVCDYIDYDKALEFILAIQNKGCIPYKAFRKNGSNCSRIVTDTILASTDHPKIRKKLLRNSKFTPSTVGNVEKSALHNTIYEVNKGSVKKYQSSAFRENIKNYFDKKVENKSNEFRSDYLAKKEDSLLSGIGSSAFFRLTDKNAEGLYEIRRYTISGKEDFRGLFKDSKNMFKKDLNYKFVYESNCKFCHIQQEDNKIKFDLVKRIN